MTDISPRDEKLVQIEQRKADMTTAFREAEKAQNKFTSLLEEHAGNLRTIAMFGDENNFLDIILSDRWIMAQPVMENEVRRSLFWAARHSHADVLEKLVHQVQLNGMQQWDWKYENGKYTYLTGEALQYYKPLPCLQVLGEAGLVVKPVELTRFLQKASRDFDNRKVLDFILASGINIRECPVNERNSHEISPYRYAKKYGKNDAFCKAVLQHDAFERRQMFARLLGRSRTPMPQPA